MTSRNILKLNQPEDCYYLHCPAYCTQWSSDMCLESYEQGKGCGLCPDDEETFMQPGQCYSCVMKLDKDNHDYSWATGKKNTKKKGGRR